MENLTDDQFENIKVSAEVMAMLLGAQQSDEIILPKRGDIDYTRPLKEYPTATDISKALKGIKKPQHIYTKDLSANGVCVQDSFEKYLSSDHHGSSTIKEILTTPMNYAFAISNDRKELEKVAEKKDFLDLGTFLHQAILEPTKFSRVCVYPKGSMASLKGVQSNIDFWEKLIIDKNVGYNEQGEEITPAECIAKAQNDLRVLNLSMDKIDGMKEYCRSLEALSGITPVTEAHYLKIMILKKHYENYAGGLLPRLLKHSKREISMYSVDEETGIPVKVRPDALQFAENIGVNAIISIKSTGVKDLRAFAYRSAELHYDLSEGMYQEVATDVTGRDFNTTITIMLQTIEPFAIAVLVWKAEDIEMGKYKYRMALRDIQKCQETGQFKGFEAYAEDENFGLIDFGLPQWNNRELLPKS